MGQKELTFTIFLMHQLAESWGKSPSEVYSILESGNVIDDYIVPCYDVLHTLGAKYLVEDLTELVTERGLA